MQAFRVKILSHQRAPWPQWVSLACCGLFVFSGCGPKPPADLIADAAPPAIATRSLETINGAAFAGSEICCRYIGSESFPSSKSRSSVIDPLSIAGHFGDVYNVPVGQVTRAVFRTLASELDATAVEDPTAVLCTVKIRLATFRLRFHGRNKQCTATCEVAYQVDFEDSNRHVVFSKRVCGAGNSEFDGINVPDAVWIAAYQASTNWFTSASGSTDVAIALKEIPGEEALEIDARIVSVGTGLHITSAHATDRSPTQMRRAVEELTAKLLNSGQLQKQSRVAVVAFEDDGPRAKQEELGRKLADMVTTALGKDNTRGFEIIERKQFRRLLAARDLNESDLVEEKPNTLRKLKEVDYLIMGSVSCYQALPN